MLSKKDIHKELGCGINIVPLNEENIKENSVNVTISEYAWTTGGGTVCWCGGSEFHMEYMAPVERPAIRKYTFRKGKRAIYKIPDKNKQFLILLPHLTTIVETKEVIGLGEKIGGAVHSKVGIVAKGVGDTGTMLGPGYCGHLMISLHNITEDVIALPLDSTFASLTFDYLNTPVKRTSSTSSSHYDKLLAMGIKLDDQDSAYFQQDWKGNLQETQKKLKQSKEFKDFKEQIKRPFKDAIKEWCTVKRMLALAGIVAVLVGCGMWANALDQNLTSPVWVERYWSVLVVGVLGYVIPKVLSKVFE